MVLGISEVAVAASKPTLALFWRLGGAPAEAAGADLGRLAVLWWLWGAPWLDGAPRAAGAELGWLAVLWWLGGASWLGGAPRVAGAELGWLAVLWWLGGAPWLCGAPRAAGAVLCCSAVLGWLGGAWKVGGPQAAATALLTHWVWRAGCAPTAATALTRLSGKFGPLSVMSVEGTEGAPTTVSVANLAERLAFLGLEAPWWSRWICNLNTRWRWKLLLRTVSRSEDVYFHWIRRRYKLKLVDKLNYRSLSCVKRQHNFKPCVWSDFQPNSEGTRPAEQTREPERRGKKTNLIGGSMGAGWHTGELSSLVHDNRAIPLIAFPP